jgi:hypothetical protein
LREYGDLDLLLPAASICRARQLLEGLGYLPKYPLTLALEQKMLSTRRQYHMMLSHPDRALVELHWRTDGDYAVERSDEPGWWDRLPDVEIQGASVPCLPEDEFLLALCLHGSKHYWVHLRWLVDVAELLRPLPEAKWHRLVNRARELHAERRCALGLILACERLEVPIPRDIQTWLRSVNGASRLAAEIADEWPRLDPPPQTAIDRMRLDFALCDRPGQRIRHFGRTVLMPGIAEWSESTLPGPLQWAYVPLRLGGLVTRQIRSYLSIRKEIPPDSGGNNEKRV